MTQSSLDPNEVRFFSGSSHPQLASDIVAHLGLSLDKTLISRFSKVRFLVPLPFCTWGMGLLAVVASLAMRIFSGVGIPGPSPVCLDS